jgi:uncharacterized protein (DUF1684 family)
MTDAEPADVEAILTLADWRRQIGTLSADVRRIAATDPAAALDHWRSVRERLYREHPQSPVPADRRAGFRARHFDHDPALRFELTIEPLAAGGSSPAAPAAASHGAPDSAPLASLAGGGAIDFGAAAATADRATGPGAAAPTRSGPVDLPVSGGGVMAFRRFGAVTIPFAAGPRRLELYWMEGYAGGLFLPFRDATNGTETYGAGRYLLDAAKSADHGGDRAAGTLVLDFNFAFQPSCAFDPKWACPLAPPPNRLDVAVRAGERLG